MMTTRPRMTVIMMTMHGGKYGDGNANSDDNDTNDGDVDDCNNDTGRTCGVSMYHRQHDFILLEHARCKTLISCRMLYDSNDNFQIFQL